MASPAPTDGTFETPADQAPCPLDRLLRRRQPGLSWGRARRAIQTGKVRVGGRVITDVTFMVGPGVQIDVRARAPRPRPASTLGPDAFAHVDPHVVVVRKPPGINSVPYDEDDRSSLEHLVRDELNQTSRRSRSAMVAVVHRLDKETSGLLVFARTEAARRHLKLQFRVHSVTRHYLALAHGHVESGTISSRLVADRGDGRRGSTSNPRLGKVAITHVRARRYLPGATLVQCRLDTGRTHQIRIHLSESGHPIVGERVYVGPPRRPCTNAPRLMLHAAELGFEHPVSGQRLHFEEPLPPDFASYLTLLERHRA